MRNVLILLLILIGPPVLAQKPTPIGLQLRAYLDAPHAPGAEVDLFLRGDALRLTSAVLAVEGRVKAATRHIVNATIPVHHVEALAAHPAVEGIEFSLDRGQVLNDSMRAKTGVDRIQAGVAPLLQGFDGSGVIIGIIDSGLDLSHPDFQDSLGRTRVLHYWDQTLPLDLQWTPQPFGYGQSFDSTAINAGLCPAVDQPFYYGHGSTVAGTAAGNGLANGRHKGVAPASDLVIVSSDFNRPNWRSSVADAVKYVFDIADALGRPAVVNASLGTYFGSHDGLDAAALLVDALLDAAPGRAMVCAAGNSGQLLDYHLSYPLSADTTYTWFLNNPASGLGFPCVYFELWADTADFDQAHFAMGSDRIIAGVPRFRGRTPFHTIHDVLGQVVTDTLWSIYGNRLGVVQYYGEQRGGQYRMDVLIAQPDSVGDRFRFETFGQGTFHVWSTNQLGTSRMVYDFTGLVNPPDPTYYRVPDGLMRTVDAWACSDKTITVGQHRNEQVYTDYTGTLVNMGGVEGALTPSSSRGPTRDGRLKPEVSAPGDLTFSAAPLDWVQYLIANDPVKVDQGGMHIRAGGTSIASPVVAGTVALLFQRCPQATWANVKQAIQGSARADAFTGGVPNDFWGFGKLDAFQAIVAMGPALSFNTPTTICDGDSVLVEVPSDLVSYTWSNGIPDPAFYQSSSGDVWIEGSNAAGCFGRSDTLSFTLVPLPPAPQVIQVGNTLESTPGTTYQWFFEGDPIPGADQQTLDVFLTGNYTVLITDPNGCASESDPYFVLSTTVREMPVSDGAVWPVPATGLVQVHLTGSDGVVELAIRDARGALVWNGQRSVTGERLTLDVSGHPAGIYHLVVQGTGQVLRFAVQ